MEIEYHSNHIVFVIVECGWQIWGYTNYTKYISAIWDPCHTNFGRKRTAIYANNGVDSLWISQKGHHCWSSFTVVMPQVKPCGHQQLIWLRPAWLWSWFIHASNNSDAETITHGHQGKFRINKRLLLYGLLNSCFVSRMGLGTKMDEHPSIHMVWKQDLVCCFVALELSHIQGNPIFEEKSSTGHMSPMPTVEPKWSWVNTLNSWRSFYDPTSLTVGRFTHLSVG